MPDSEHQADLLIIGGGLAGMSAGLRAAELGCRVVVLEKGSDKAYLCNSRIAGGVLHIAYNDPKGGAEALLKSILTQTCGQANRSQAEALANGAGPLIDWLRSHDAKFMSIPQLPWYRWCMAPPRPFGPGLDWKGRGPDVLLRTLTEHFLARGGTLLLGCKANKISASDDAFKVTVERDGADTVHEGRTLLIADGGFQADAEMFRKYIGPRPDLVCQRNARTGQGDGLRMASEIGAAIVGTSRFYGHLLSRDAIENEKLWPYPQLDDLVASALVVNPAGHRFIDEGSGGIVLANRLAASEHPAEGIVIVDAAIWQEVGRRGRIPANPHLERAGATIYKADSLAELAGKAGIASAAFEQTIAAWNAAVDTGRWEGLAPPRTITPPVFKMEDMRPWPIRTAPFMAIPMCAGITYTMGGILVDGDARVLREDGSVIDGLYAAGATTGGLEGGGSEDGYTGGLSKAAVLGLRAAESAAQFVRSDRSHARSAIG